MFKVTFLGHQGWMVSAARARILIDPLLEEDFGATPESGLKVYPPRLIAHGDFPPISAVFISHEHDDHFQIASLNRLDRRIPLFLSERSSHAAHRAAEEMGFSVQSIEAGVPIRVGDLELKPYAPGLKGEEATVDEWDVVPYLVRDEGGHGSFFSSVDVAAPPAAMADLRDLKEPGIVTFANNASSFHLVQNWASAPAGAVPVAMALISEMQRRTRAGWRPQIILGSGGGWSFSGEKASWNRGFFPADNEVIRDILRSSGVAGMIPFEAPLPGESVSMVDGVVRTRELEQMAFLRATSRETWPFKRYDPGQSKVLTLPMLKRGPGGPGDEDRVRSSLKELARFLVGSSLFVALHSITRAELDGKRRAFVIGLEDPEDEEGRLYEYCPSRCDFVPASAAVEEYAAGALCWRNDFLALMSAEVSAPAFIFGHLLEWVSCQSPEPAAFAISPLLWRMIHPLRYPDAFSRMYRKSIAALDRTRPTIPHASGQARG
jgi:hypothetical protein